MVKKNHISMVEISCQLMTTRHELHEIKHKIVHAGHVCYRKEAQDDRDLQERIGTPPSEGIDVSHHRATKRDQFIHQLIESGHHSVLEHGLLTFEIITDRSITHELVRHRIASFSQESTRYVSYAKDGGLDMSVISPIAHFTNAKSFEIWASAMINSYDSYCKLLDNGETPQMARSVLPNSLSSKIVMSLNIREYLHFLHLRLVNKTGKAHPQMQETAALTLKILLTVAPFMAIFFLDIMMDYVYLIPPFSPVHQKEKEDFYLPIIAQVKTTLRKENLTK